MKKLVIIVLIIFLSTNLVYSKGSGEINQIDIAKELLEEKKYNDAIALLTSYVSENPNAIYEVQVLIDEIREERDKNNNLMGDIIRVLYDEQNSEEGAKLIKEYEANNPFPDELSKIFIKNAREAATFVINQKHFKEYMDQALEHLRNREFNMALDKYLLCLDFHHDEFDLLLDGEVVTDDDIDFSVINEDVSLNGYYISLKNRSFEEINIIKTQTEELKKYISKLKEAYSTSLTIIDSDVINISRLMNNLEIFKTIPNYLSMYNKTNDHLDQYNDLFSRISIDGTKSKFISYASLTLTGRKDISEGFLYLINRMYPLYIEDIISKIDEKAQSELSLGISLYNRGEYVLARITFDNAINIFKALDSTASLWKVFVKIDKNFNITGTEILEKKYHYIADSIIGIDIIKSYKKLTNYVDSVNMSEENDRSEIFRTLLVSQNTNIHNERARWINKGKDVNSRTIMRYLKSPKWIDEIEGQYKLVEENFIQREITLLDKISKESYISIFGFDADQVDDNSDAMASLIRKAAEDINTPEKIDVYFDINNTDERSLITYNPGISLVNLAKIEGDYETFINRLNGYITKFGIEKDYIFENSDFRIRYESVTDALESANTNNSQLMNYKKEAEDQITLSKESENRGSALYQSALAAFDNENFNEARELIETGKNVSEIAISYSKNSFVINKLIPSFYNLWDKISEEEARIVIRDVRKLITQGKIQYLEGAYIPASNLFKEAELKWSETNSDAHPEIPYWLALIRDALDIESGRYLTITEPLYSILAGYLSFAENYYRIGLKENNKVNRLKYFAIADSYIVKVLEVRPLNERARFLQLQVLKSKDPEAFKVIFNNDFIRYRNSVLRAIDNNSTLESDSVLATLRVYENIVKDAYLLNPRLSGSKNRVLLERFYKTVTTIGKSQVQVNREKSENDENRKKINESYIRFKDLYKISEADQRGIVKRLMNISEVALGFKRLPIDTSNIRESNSIFLQAQSKLEATNQSEIDVLNNILVNLQHALSLNPGNENIPVVIDDILVMLGEESHFQLAPAQDKIFREAQKDFIDGRYYDAKDKIVEILGASSKNKNYPKLKELINRVEIKIKEEITIQ